MVRPGFRHAGQCLQRFFDTALAVGTHHAFHLIGDLRSAGCRNRAGGRHRCQIRFFHQSRSRILPLFIMAGIMEFEEVQAQGVHANGEAGYAHGRRPHHGVHLIAEQPGCQRDADDIVEEGPEQVFVNVGHSAPAQPDRGRDIRQAAVHQHDIRRIDGHIGACPDGDPDVRTRQGRCIVDAVADHGDQAAGFLEFPDHRFLPFRQHSGHDPVHTGLSADGFCRPLVVARDHDHFNAHVLEFFDRFGGIFLDDVGYGNHSGQFPVFCKDQRGFALTGQLRSPGFQGAVHGHLRFQEIQAAAQEFGTLPDHLEPIAGQCLESIDSFRLHALCLCFFHNRPGQRMFRFLFQIIGQLEQAFLRIAFRRHHVRHFGLSFRNGPGLVQGHHGHFPGVFQRRRSLEQDSVLGTHAAAHHDGYRCGKSQRTRAGDDQYGDTPGNGLAQRRSGDQPADGGDDGNADDGRDEHGGYPIGDPGDRSLRRSRVTDELDDLRKGRIFAHTGRFTFQIPGLVDGGSGNLVPRFFIHGQAFTGQSAFVHSGIALDDDTVHGDVLTGTDGEDIALLHIVDGNSDFPAVTDQDGSLGRQFHKTLQCVRRAALAHGFQHLTQRDQGRDHGSRLKVQIMHVHMVQRRKRRSQRCQIGDLIEHRKAPEKGDRGTECHQGIHIRRPMQQCAETARIEIFVDVHHNDGEQHLGQHESQMVPIQQRRYGPAQHIVSHRQIHEDEQESQGRDQTAAETRRIMILQGFLVGSQFLCQPLLCLGGPLDRGTVARFLDSLDDGTVACSPFHPHAVGQQGNRDRGHAGNGGHCFFHMSLTGCTGHACHYILFHICFLLYYIPYQGIVLWSYHNISARFCQYVFKRILY